MILIIFDAASVIYTNVVPKRTTVNAAFIVKALGVFIQKLNSK